MKKITALFLALFMLTGVFASIAVFAEEGTEGSTDHEDLITHWDFEGSTPDEELLDKASGGKTSDALTASGEVIVNDGVAYITNNADTYLTAEGKEGSDLYQFQKNTIIMRARFDNAGTRLGVASIISKDNVFEWTFSNTDTSTFRARVNGAKQGATEGTVAAVMGEFRYYIMTFDYDSTAATYTATAYMSSSENPMSISDFVILAQWKLDSVSEDQPIVTSEKNIYLGRRYDHISKVRDLLCYFDDVKIYSDVLELSEILSECNGDDIDMTFFESYDKSQYGVYNDILNSLKIMAIGDSYLDGSGLHYSWIDLLAKKYRMQYVDHAIGGTTVASFEGYPQDRVPMVLRYGEMLNEEEAPDIIFIEGGRNDRQNKIPIGDLKDTSETTYLGALNIMIDAFREAYPESLIICLTPWGYIDGNGAAEGFYGTTADYAAAMVRLCKARNVACMNCADPAVSGVDMNNQEFYDTYSLNDSVSHLNADGMAYVLPFFESFINTAYTSFKSNGQSIIAVADIDTSAPSDTEPADTGTSDTDSVAKDTGSVTEDPSSSDSATTSAQTSVSATDNNSNGCASSIAAYQILIPVLTLTAVLAFAGIRKRKRLIS